jgi:hypothetical protein
VVKTASSPLSSAPLDRARDVLILAQRGDMTCRRLWNDFAAESPGSARIVAAWVQKDNAKRAKVTARVDATLERAELVTKAMGPGTCLKCHYRLKAKWPKCPSCGAKSKLYRKPASKAAPMKKLRARPKKTQRVAAKAVAAGILNKSAAASGARWEVQTPHQAVGAILANQLLSPDPGVREAARVALARRA